MPLPLCLQEDYQPLREAAAVGGLVKPSLRPAEAEAHPVHLRQPASQSLFLGRARHHAAARRSTQLLAGASLNRFVILASAQLLGTCGPEFFRRFSGLGGQRTSQPPPACPPSGPGPQC